MALHEHVPPSHGVDSFNCPYCGAFAHQEWSRLRASSFPMNDTGAEVSKCSRCHELAYWIAHALVAPASSPAPPPHPEMPSVVKDDYLEASDVAARSPRSASALLRLALQELMPLLDEKGDNLNDDIASLVQKGLPVQVQQSLDALRVVGNNAVHPGEMDLKDDAATATALFGLLNYIVEQRIEQPRKLRELYESLPAGALEAIEKRDGS